MKIEANGIQINYELSGKKGAAVVVLLTQVRVFKTSLARPIVEDWSVSLVTFCSVADLDVIVGHVAAVVVKPVAPSRK